MKIKTEQLVIGGLLLWFLWPKNTRRSAPYKPPVPDRAPPINKSQAQTEQPDPNSLAGCYHAVV